MQYILPTILSLLAATSNAAAISTRDDGGLSFRVPPPPCLNICIKTLDACTLCTPNNTYSACIQKGCAPKDISYANAYLGSICSNGGYVSFAVNPPGNVYIASDPRTACPHI